jgi:DNA-binding response OmpR family regulator
MRILVVEDDRKVARFLERGLKEEGYVVDVAHEGPDGLAKAHIYEYDLILLDVMLPETSGYEIVRDLRKRGNAVPVLMLTARDSPEDMVRGLDLGADDYLAKPFSFDVLLARMRALLRRGAPGGAGGTLAYDDLEMDRLRRTVSRAGSEAALTPKEFRLLEYLLQRPEEVVRRTELLEKVWDLQFDPMSNVVDVHVANLRRKLRVEGRPELIHTVRGVGYMVNREAPG